jgi:hypothetical protein
MTVVKLKQIGFYTKGKDGFIGYFTTKTGLSLTVEAYLHLLKKKAFNIFGQKIVLPYLKMEFYHATISLTFILPDI